ncbi:MAG: hypothetical protein ACLQLH_03605 [Terracidiphilus sp.]
MRKSNPAIVRTYRSLATQQFEFAQVCRERGNLADAHYYTEDARRYLHSADSFRSRFQRKAVGFLFPEMEASR